MESHAISAEPEFTGHALLRMEQRRVTPAEVKGALERGNEYSAGRGCVAFVTGESDRTSTRSRQRPGKRQRMLAVVVNDHGAVASVYRLDFVPTFWRRMR